MRKRLALLRIRRDAKSVTRAYKLPKMGKTAYLLLMNQTMTTGQVIRHMRRLADLTGEQLAEDAEISPTYLSRVENGRSRPSDRWVASVLSVLSAAIARKAAEDVVASMGVSA